MKKTFKTLLSPEIPEKFSLVKSISGLDKNQTFKPRSHFSSKTFSEQPGILPEDIKAAYEMTGLYQKGLTGRNQHIAIASYMNFSMEDIAQYFSKIGLYVTPTVDIVYFNGRPPYDLSSAAETEMNVQLAGTLAPGSQIHVFPSAENSTQGELLLFTAILDDNRSKIVNYGWGMDEVGVSPSHLDQMARVFARAIAQGVNIFVASGDQGSHATSWPTTNPNIIAVGGTSLYVNPDKSKRETASEGSGGGISSIYPLPAWQSDFQAPFVRRAFPDLAFNTSGQGVWIRSDLHSEADWFLARGTGNASSQWAGFLALVNEARQAKGKGPLGFLNPTLYGASEHDKGKIFNDIISGSNGTYPAGKGWDAVTGWGSMRGVGMLNYLLAL